MDTKYFGEIFEIKLIPLTKTLKYIFDDNPI